MARTKTERTASKILAANAKALTQQDEAVLHAYAERHKRSLAFVVREALTHYAALLRENNLEPPSLPAPGALDRDISTGGKTNAHITTSQPIGGKP